MRMPMAAELLKVWEWGNEQTAVQKALGLLLVAWPENSPDELAGLSIGQRDGRLLGLRERLCGPKLASVAVCLACGERLELNFLVSDILVTTPPPPAVLSIAQADYAVNFRLPNSQDLLRLASSNITPDTGRHLLVEGCILEARQNGQPLEVADLPDALIEKVIAGMAAADPQADVQLALNCPRCGHAWELTFDIVSFFWQELNGWADRLLHDVHILALTYGWNERDILALSEWRRQYYLGIIHG